MENSLTTLPITKEQERDVLKNSVEKRPLGSLQFKSVPATSQKVIFLPPYQDYVFEDWKTIVDFSDQKDGGIDANELLKYL